MDRIGEICENMKSSGFYIVDVFAEDKYAGNQLAVVTNGQGLSSERMQQIAREFNFSETTFILSGRQDNEGYDVRIFTPGEQVPFAGHPTVGTAWVIRNLLNSDRPDTVLVFCAQTLSTDSQLHVRVFGPLVGVPEDPATGSANSCPAGYLVRHRYFGTDAIDIQAEQGYEMGRPSCLYLKAQEKPGSRIQVRVGGKVQFVAKGELV